MSGAGPEPEDRLYLDAALVRFYDIDNGRRPDLDFCAAFAAGARSVLDLGCGTGQLAASLAGNRDVAGVDPAAAMLDVARARPGGDRVDWVEADARTVRLGRSFDLVVMTGHAFQVFLTRRDRLAVLRTVAAHLGPEGRFVLDSRNPAVAEWREWTPELSRRAFDDPLLGRIEAWNDFAFDAASTVVTYGTFYRLPDGRVLGARSRIAFPGRDEIETLVAEAGLAVERWLGDWAGGDWHESAPEIIPVGGKA